MTGVTPLTVRRPEDLDEGWLSGALASGGLLEAGQAVHSFGIEPVGTGQMADTVRIRYRTGSGAPEAERSVVAKFASADEQSRSTGLMTRAYEIEVAFYEAIARRVGIRTPACYFGQYEPETGWFVLLLEDVVGGVPGEQLAGCSPEAAEAALAELAALHGTAWARPELARLPWLHRGGPKADTFLVTVITSLWPDFLQRYGARLDAEHRDACDRFVGQLAPWLATRPGPTTVTHGDFRVDNLLFPPGQGRPSVVDWQTTAWGAAAADVSYFLGASLTVEHRRQHGERLVAGYHRALVDHGVEGFTLDRLVHEYRATCAGGLVMSIGAAMLVSRTERGDDMFVTSVARYAQQVLDLDALSG